MELTPPITSPETLNSLKEISMIYLQLTISIVLEVLATSLMKKTDGFTNITPTIAMLACYGGSFYFVSIVVKTLPVGIVYATWSGLGIVLVSAIAYFVFKQALDLPAVIGMALIIVGVVIINVFSKMSAH